MFNLSIRVNSHRDADGSNEHGVYFTAAGHHASQLSYTGSYHTINTTFTLNDYMHVVISKAPNGDVKLFLNGNFFHKITGSQLDRFDFLQIRNHNKSHHQ